MAEDPKKWDPNQATLDLPEELLPKEPEFKLVEVKAHTRKVRIKKTKETTHDHD